MSTKKRSAVEDSNEILVRIMGQDVAGSKSVFVGLTKIKGVSWAVSNMICFRLGLDKKMKIGELGKDKIGEIENAFGNFDAPVFMKNRRNDFDSGESNHLIGIKLDMRKDFDLKRLKQIKSYKGVRHSFKLPVRGQKTRSHFRKSGIAVGVKKPKTGKKS